MHKHRTSNWTAPLTLVLLLAPSVAFAQGEAAPPADGGGGETVKEAAQETGIKFDLRIWGGNVTPVEGRAVDKETFDLPMFGFTGTYSPAKLENFGFMFTFLWGFGEGDVNELSSNYFAFGDQETIRYDFEFLIRYSLPESPVYLFTGLRWVSWEEEGDRVAIDGGAFGLVDETVDVGIFYVELGVGMTGNITADGKHRLFANMVFGLGWFGGEYDYSDVFQGVGVDPVEQIRYDLDWDEFSYSVDGNVGYQATITDQIDIGLRYRVFLIAAELTGSDMDATLVHGLELTVGFRF